jgi:hypothetical protein
MLLRDFGERAEECLRLAAAAATRHDRDFLVALAQAWCGVTEEEPEQTDRLRTH